MHIPTTGKFTFLNIVYFCCCLFDLLFKLLLNVKHLVTKVQKITTRKNMINMWKTLQTENTKNQQQQQQQNY